MKACDDLACRNELRRRTQASWRERNPDYELGRQLDQRKMLSEAERRDGAARFGAPLARVPWDRDQDAFGAKGADFIGIFGRVLLAHRQDETRAQATGIIGELRGHLPLPPKDEMQSRA